MKYVYVDYENLNNLKCLEQINGKYFFFIGTNQVKINAKLILSTNNVDVEWIEIEGSGKNALDFHVAYYIAKNDEDKAITHFILSKDTGFDPLIRHLKRRNVDIKRIITLNEINNKVKSKDEKYNKVESNLLKITKTKRPQSIKKLYSHIEAMLKDISESEINEIIEELFRHGFISSSSSSGSRIKYMK